MGYNDLLQGELPFELLVNFQKVFDLWEDKLLTGTPSERERASEVLEIVNAIPELRKPFSEFNLLEKYSEEIALLLSPLFPEALQTNEIKTAVVPFRSVFFNQTERFRKILSDSGSQELRLRTYEDEDLYISAASYVLKMLYQDVPNFGRPSIIDSIDQTTGTVRTFRGFINADFGEIRRTKHSPDLTPAQIKRLYDHAERTDLWKELIPPGSFQLHGFALLTIFDITQDDALSELKNGLIKKDALTSRDSIQEIEKHLRRFFDIRDLQIGLAIKSHDHFMPVQRGDYPLILQDLHTADKDAMFCDGTYEAIFKQKRYLALADVSVLNHDDNPLYQRLASRGIESYMICPLVSDDKVIGFLELGSKERNKLSTLLESRMREIAPLFETALKRSLDEHFMKVDSIIKQKCTAIHPTVEWKFQEVASKLINGASSGREAEMDEIVFEKVVPLFGQFDIRKSSRFRDQGIRDDLRLQLDLARQVLSEAHSDKPFPWYEQLIFKIDQYLQRLEHALLAGDETEIITFLQGEVESVFDHMSQQDESLQLLVQSYQNRIDQNLGRVYEGRRKYDETVQLINEHISVSLNRAQFEAQDMFSHYFEMYKTDGVEYNMYIGQSLVQDQTYHPMFLRNLRLWQLTTTLEVERLIKSVSNDFAVPLEIASLILVQDTSIDIRFRLDEKRFDVDGAYNVRYEILKKRIDKSLLKGTNERLTQPGKLAIVYSNDAEKKEYRDYLRFLAHHRWIASDVEDVFLEDMDGASGLKAMRVDIIYDGNERIEKLQSEVIASFEGP